MPSHQLAEVHAPRGLGEASRDARANRIYEWASFGFRLVSLQNNPEKALEKRYAHGYEV